MAAAPSGELAVALQGPLRAGEPPLAPKARRWRRAAQVQAGDTVACGAAPVSGGEGTGCRGSECPRRWPGPFVVTGDVLKSQMLGSQFLTTLIDCLW